MCLQNQQLFYEIIFIEILNVWKGNEFNRWFVGGQ